MENESLTLLQPAPEERLVSWLAEFYGKSVEIKDRQLLRHRDLSRVERIWMEDALPATLIYKQVLPPWDIEQDLHERLLIPSIAQSAQLFMAAHYGQITAMFLEDLGDESLLNIGIDSDFAGQIGRELAKLHRSYSYRIQELLPLNILRGVMPADYVRLAEEMLAKLKQWGLAGPKANDIVGVAAQLAEKLADEPISLVHGDLYAENILVRNQRLFFIDWSWFTIIGAPIMDLASLTSNHFKNGSFCEWRDTVVDAYSFESGRSAQEVMTLLPYATRLSRLLFLYWLTVRREMGIMGTTVGPVDDLIENVVNELVQPIC